MKHSPPLLALCLALSSAPALADDDRCEVPTRLWQPRDAVRQHAARQGWQVQRLKIDDGCYEIRGRDAQGREFKAKLNPQTLREVEMKWRDDRKHDRQRHQDRQNRELSEGQDTPPSPASPKSPVLPPGTTLRGQIE